MSDIEKWLETQKAEVVFKQPEWAKIQEPSKPTPTPTPTPTPEPTPTGSYTEWTKQGDIEYKLLKTGSRNGVALPDVYLIKVLDKERIERNEASPKPRTLNDPYLYYVQLPNKMIIPKKDWDVARSYGLTGALKEWVLTADYTQKELSDQISRARSMSMQSGTVETESPAAVVLDNEGNVIATSSEQWQGGEYQADVQGGGPAYVWTDSTGKTILTRTPEPPKSPAGLPAGTSSEKIVVATGFVADGQPEYINYAELSKLSPTDQALIKTQGIAAFNEYKLEQSLLAVGGQPAVNYYNLLPSADLTDEQKAEIDAKLAGGITAFTENPYPDGTKEWYLFGIQTSAQSFLGDDIDRAGGSYKEYIGLPTVEAKEAYLGDLPIKKFLSETGGNYEYYATLTPDKQKEYLEGFDWKPVEGVKGGWEFDITRGEAGERATTFLQAQEAFNEGKMPEAEFKQIESDWLAYVEGAKERASGVTIPTSPIQIEKYIISAGGNVDYYESLSDVDKNVYLQQLQVRQEMDIAEIQAQPNFNKLSQSAQMFLLDSEVGDYYKAETPELKVQWLIDHNIIPKGSTYAGEVDENGHPMVFPPTTAEELAQMREESIGSALPEGFKDFLNTPLWGSTDVTWGELAQKKLFREYGSPSAGEMVVLMPETGGRDWNIEAVNTAFQYIPYDKKVYFDVPQEIQDKMTEDNRRAGSLLAGWTKLIDIKATWNNLTDNEKALVLLNYSPTPSGIEQAIDAAHIPILYEVKNWDNLSTTEKVLGVIMDVLLVAPLISPVTRPLSALASRAVMATSIGERATTIVSNIGKEVSLAMRSGNPNLLMGAGTKLRVLGESMVAEGIPDAAYMARAGAILEQKAPTLSTWGKGLVDDLAKVEANDLDRALVIKQAESLIKPSEGAIAKADIAISKADARITADIGTKISEANNIILELGSGDRIASQAAMAKLDSTISKLAPFANEVQGFEELVGLSRIASNEIKQLGRLSDATIARIKSIQLQPGLRSPLSAMGLKLQSPLELTGEMSHLQWPFKQDFPFIRSLRQKPVGGSWGVAEYQQPIIRFRNPIVRTESITGAKGVPVVSSPPKPTITSVTKEISGLDNKGLLNRYGTTDINKILAIEMDRWQKYWGELATSVFAKEPKPLLYTKGVSTYVTRRGFPPNVVLDKYGRPLTWPDGSYITRGEFPVPRIKSPYPDDTIIGYGKFEGAELAQYSPTKYTVGSIRKEIETIGIQGAIDRFGEEVVIRYFPSVKQIINDPQFKLLQQLRKEQWADVFESGRAVRETQIAKAVEEAIQRKYTLAYNEDDYIRIWDRIEKEVDNYLGVTDDNFALLTTSQKMARESMIRNKMSEYIDGSPMIDTGTYEVFLERSGLMKEIPYRETFDRWWPTPREPRGFDPYIMPFGEPTVPLSPVQPSRLSIIGGMMLGLNPLTSGATIFDASILTQNQVDTLINNGAIFDAKAQTMTVPYEVKVESSESLAARLDPITTSAVLSIKTEKMATPMEAPIPSIAPTPRLLPVTEVAPEVTGMAEVAPAPTPIPELVAIPSPIPEPVPTPEPTPIPEPMPEPIPEPSPIPEPMPSPIPVPTPTMIGETVTEVKIPPRIIVPPIIVGSDGKPLSKKQLEGAIGWKQGIMYKYIYPPYGLKDIINSRSPIQGIPIKEGIRSAYETIIRTRPGDIPKLIRRPMGMMDVEITDADKNGQPEIHFIEREHRKGKGAVANKSKKVETAEVFNIT